MGHLGVNFASISIMRQMGRSDTYADMLRYQQYVLWVVGTDRIGFENSPSAWMWEVSRLECRSSREYVYTQVEAMLDV